MRPMNGLHVVYRGKEFKAEPEATGFLLLSEDPANLKLGFEPISPFTLGLLIVESDAEEAYRKQWWARYKGKVFPAMPGSDGRWLLYAGESQPAEFGFFQWGRGEWEKLVPAGELDEYWAEKIPSRFGC